MMSRGLHPVMSRADRRAYEQKHQAAQHQEQPDGDRATSFRDQSFRRESRADVIRFTSNAGDGRLYWCQPKVER